MNNNFKSLEYSDVFNLQIGDTFIIKEDYHSYRKGDIVCITLFDRQEKFYPVKTCKVGTSVEFNSGLLRDFYPELGISPVSNLMLFSSHLWTPMDLLVDTSYVASFLDKPMNKIEEVIPDLI